MKKDCCLEFTEAKKLGINTSIMNVCAWCGKVLNQKRLNKVLKDLKKGIKPTYMENK